jgi:hypothetical protein
MIEDVVTLIQLSALGPITGVGIEKTENFPVSGPKLGNFGNP